MERMPMCRICLVENVRMYIVIDKDLHELYETLTNIPFVTEDRRPVLACFICFVKLKQCYQLQRKCRKAEKLFAQIMYKPNTLVNQGQLEYFGGLTVTPVDNISIVDGSHIENIAIKEELPDVCERLDDVIKAEVEHQSDDAELQTVYIISSDTEDTPPLCSETDSKDDVLLKQFRIEFEEEEEASGKKRKASDTTLAPVAKRPGLQTNLKDLRTEELKRSKPSDTTVVRTSENCTSGPDLEFGEPSTCTKNCPSRSKQQNYTEVDSDDDSDDGVDDSDYLLPVARTATIEPACNADMTELQTKVLQAEDELNDQIVRDIVHNQEYYSFDWNNDKAMFIGRRDSFTGSSGPTFDVTDMTPVDIFYKMFDTQFIDRLCKETNRYAEQKIAGLKAENKLLPTSRLYRWSPTDCNEMIAFLAILILQGLYPIPEEEKYFSFNGFGTMLYFSRIMSYNRFALLKSLYHFADKETLSDRTKLYKIQPVIDYLNDKFSTLYMPAQEVAIDESLLNWHGRLSFAQKIATKAAQVGVKTYELCESRSGYLWKFYVCVGRKKAQQPVETDDRPDDETVPDDDNDITHDRHDNETPDGPQGETDRPDSSISRPTNATAKIVYKLIEPLLDRGHTIIMDNIYNSPLLLRCLKKHKTDCYGTLRLNREFMPDSLKTLNKTDLRQGEVVTSYTSDLSVMVWRDANLVSMISTYHHLQAGRHNKHSRLTYKPKILLDYNKSMGGMDRRDQLLSAQPMERVRNKVWYKKAFCRLLNTAIFNAYVIFSSHHPKMSHRQFRIILTENLLKIHRNIDLTTEPRPYINRTYSSERTKLALRTYGQPNVDHDQFPTRSEQTKLTLRTNDRPNVDHDHFPARSNYKKARCWMCSRRNRDSRTIWKCIQCGVSLCIEDCFREYHKP